MNRKWVIIVTSTLLLAAFLIWLFVESSKPLPGEKIANLGRGHVPIGTEVDYNSNPPTSGKHYEEWVRVGIYTEPKDDRNLVHSLEHGYIIMSYNCDFKVSSFQLFSEVLAHGLEEESESEATNAGQLSPAFKSDDCHKLVDQLISVYERKGKKKLIIVPRVNLDAKIALTAWNYLDKFNEFDEGRIIKFIDAHIEQGPEKTME